MQRIPVNLTNDCSGNQLNYNNDLPAIGKNNYAPDFAPQYIFLCKIICKNYLIIKFIEMYSLIFT